MIKNIEIKKATGEKGNSFVGIIISNNQIEFHCPESYTLSNDGDHRQDILNILRVIHLSDSRSRDLSNFNTKFKENSTYPLASYLWILNDYFENKRYVNKEKNLKFGQQGKIEWNKTIRQIPFYSNGELIFPQLISEVSKQQDNILTEIYSYCVYTAIDEIGWYYNISNSEYSKDDFIFNKGRYISALKTAINRTFDDKKRSRLVHMKNIVTGLDDKNKNTKSMVRGVDSFEHIFESMIDLMFGNVDFKKKFFPNAEYILIEEDSPKETSKLRPDTIFIKDKKLFIVDSKYYRYGTTFNYHDLPETTSIEKQITYGDFVKRISSDYDEIYNAFIIPYSKELNKNHKKYNSNLEFLGIARAKWPLDKTNKYQKIAVILIDLKFLINNYLEYSDKYVEQLSKLIEENVKKY